MISFAAYTAAETPDAFQWARQSPEIAHSSLGISTPSNTWFQSVPQTAPRSVQPFLQGSRKWPTDRQTNRQTTVLSL